MSDHKEEAVPFFARYLEGQVDFMAEISEEEAQTVGGGGKVMTQKYPSDNEETGGGIAVTQKYPSDNEDSSGGGGKVVTYKYPSDSDECSYK